MEEQSLKEAHEDKVQTDVNSKKEGKDEKKDPTADLIAPEQMLPGKITPRDYYNLFKYGRFGILGFTIFMLTGLVTALFQLATSFTLANWT